MISQKSLTNTTKSDKVDTMITQEMIDYIDERAPEIDPWAWYELYGNVLEYLDEYENDKPLSDRKVSAIVKCYNDLQNWQG
jgi:hypothetical protein